MIIIKMYNNQWQIHIGNEIWEFESLGNMKAKLSLILDIKDKYGRLKDDIKN